MADMRFLDRVSVTTEDKLARVTLDRAGKHNGLDRDMMKALVQTAHWLRRQKDLRAVVVHGAGESFCAGLDFPAMTRRPLRLLGDFFKFGVRDTNLFQKVCWCWRELPMPVLAVLHGRCYGGGLQIALAADFRFSTPDCEFSIMEIKWGLVPDMTGSVTLRELARIDAVKELAMTGRVFSGSQALQLGLVSHVMDDPMAGAEQLAGELLGRSPDAVSACKRLFQDAWAATPQQAFDLESRLQFRLLTGANQREAMKANFDKRPPDFRPRKR